MSARFYIHDRAHRESTDLVKFGSLRTGERYMIIDRTTGSMVDEASTQYAARQALKLARLNSRELLYCFHAETFEVLVPTKRGGGFLLVPYGHHNNPELSRIGDKARCEVSGLDGSLSFDCGLKVTCYNARKAELVALVMPLLEAHYKCKSREVTRDEFWKNCPGKIITNTNKPE